jgi:hypothetical protein
MRYFAVLGLLLAIAVSNARAQETTPSAEFSASYSFLREGLQDGVNANGGSVSVAVNPNRWLGVVADVGGYHAAPFNNSLNTVTYLFGPRFSYRRLSKVTPFAQVLVGGAHLSGGGASANGFTVSAGGGIDLSVSQRLALRTQVDYIGIRPNDHVLNAVRGSFGIVYRFGR